jgi:dihydrofolate reductase
LIRTHIGVSLDGFVATPDGEPAWDAIPTFGPGTHGIAELNEQCEAIVVGRTSFDQGFRHWLPNWPWPGKTVYVLTSSALPAEAAAQGVVAAQGGPAGLVRRLREAGHSRDVQVLGGPRTIQALLEVGGIDRLGLVVLPVLLGKGIPLFPIEIASFSPQAWAAAQAAAAGAPSRPMLRLDRHRAFPDGAVELVYAPRAER